MHARYGYAANATSTAVEPVWLCPPCVHVTLMLSSFPSPIEHKHQHHQQQQEESPSKDMRASTTNIDSPHHHPLLSFDDDDIFLKTLAPIISDEELYKVFSF